MCLEKIFKGFFQCTVLKVFPSVLSFEPLFMFSVKQIFSKFKNGAYLMSHKGIKFFNIKSPQLKKIKLIYLSFFVCFGYSFAS
jgi:hypothetical protein